MKLALGESVTAVYRAKNLSDRPTVGSATFNVTPFNSGQLLQQDRVLLLHGARAEAGRERGLPVTFFVDPEIRDDADTADIQAITLSYTFFRGGRRRRAAASSGAATPAATIN